MWPYDDSEAEWLEASAPAVPVRAAAPVVSLDAVRSEARKAAAPTVAETVANENTGLVGRLIGRIRSWRDRQDARARLYAMSERELADIGLTRDAIDMAVGGTETSRATAFNNGGVLGGAVHGLTRGATNWWQAA